MPVIDETALFYAKNKMSQQAAKLAGDEVFGFKSCDVSWGELIAKHLIIDMIECTGADSLNQSEVDCLIGKASEDLTVNCC